MQVKPEKNIGQFKALSTRFIVDKPYIAAEFIYPVDTADYINITVVKRNFKLGIISAVTDFKLAGDRFKPALCKCA